MSAMLRHSKILADALPHVSRGSRPVVLAFLCAGRRYSSAGIRGHSHGTNSKNQSDHERANVGTFAAGKAALLVGASIGSGVLGYIFAQNQQTHETHDTTANALPDSPTFGSPLEFQKAISELKATFADESAVSTDPGDLHVHGSSENDYYPGAFHYNLRSNQSPTEKKQTGAPHSVVVYPESTADVVKIVKIATKYRMPITPYSGATSLEGHFRGVSLPFPEFGFG